MVGAYRRVMTIENYHDKHDNAFLLKAVSSRGIVWFFEQNFNRYFLRV